MPYTQNFAQLRFGGPAWANAEEWCCSVKLKHIGGDAADPMLQEAKDTVAAVAAEVRAYITSLGARFPVSHTLSWVSLNPINKTTGLYLFPNDAVIYDLPTPARGLSGGNVPQVAYCVTTRSVIKRGPAAFGRWYMPAPDFQITSTGVIEQSVCQELANAAGTFLKSLQEIESGQGPTAWSPWHYGSGKGGPADSSVASVGVGNVADTQRRRRNQIVETYFPATTYQ